MTNTDQSDEELVASAHLLVAALKQERGGTLVDFAISKVGSTNTRGRCVDLGNIREKRVTISLWLEHALDEQRLGYWAGFYANKRDLSVFVKDMELTDIKTFSLADYEQKTNNMILKNPPDSLEEGFPVFDQAWKDVNYYGVYGRIEQPFDTARFSMFIGQTLRALPEFNTCGSY